MLLTSQVYRVTKSYKGKTKFDFWMELEPDHSFEVSMTLKPTGRRRGRIYAPILTIKNLNTGQVFKDTIKSIQVYLSKIEYIEFETI